MPRKSSDTHANATKNIGDAALSLAARHGWSTLTLEQIAKAAKISPAILRRHFAEKNLILPAIVKQIDEKVALTVGKKIARDTVPHDRLFEILMARFDALQVHRQGILAIFDDTRRDPALAKYIVPAEWQSAQDMLDLARLGKGRQSFYQPLAAAGLLGVYGWVFCCWKRDETPDMAKTMAALDRGLRCAGMAAEILFRNP